MSLSEKLQVNGFASRGKPMFKLIKQLYPICRSITGNGVRETLSIISEVIPITIHEVPSNTKVLDWEIPLNGILPMHG